MSLSEVAVAIGLLTPLVLGILAFIEKFINRKKGNEPVEAPPVVQGMTVATDSYADRLIRELEADRKKAEADRLQAEQENKILRAQLDVYKGRGDNV
jgi:hypothetical protein